MSGFKVELKGLDEAIKKLDVEVLKKEIRAEVDAFGFDVYQDAQQLAPRDESALAQSIYWKPINGVKDLITIEIGANIDYAAYVEFGTRKFAAAYVATLPPDWQTFARKYKGSGSGGGIEDFFARILAWVKRKQITGLYSVKSRKRAGVVVRNLGTIKQGQQLEDEEAAYAIALYILRNGSRAHPFLFPAFEKNRPKLIERLKALLSSK